jgi:hypothetical protein
VADATRVDVIGLFQVGVPRVVGGQTITANDNGTVTRTCNGCGRTVTTPIVAGRVVEAKVKHAADCQVMDSLSRANNPTMS